MTDPDPSPFVARRQRVIERLIALGEADPRVVAVWLEGSLADGTADPLSDVDAYVAVEDAAFEGVWADRRALAERIGQVLVSADVPAWGLFACILDGPIKLDLHLTSVSRALAASRPAMLLLLDNADLASRLTVGWTPPIDEVRRRVETLLRMTFQGATWPVRLLARGQWWTWAMVQLELINDTLAPLLAVREDVGLLYKNRISMPRLLTGARRDQLAQLAEAVLRAVAARDLAAARDAHLRIYDALVRESRAACIALDLEFPLAAEGNAAIRAFFEREWPT